MLLRLPAAVSSAVGSPLPFTSRVSLCRQLVQEDLSAQFVGWIPVRDWLMMLLALPFVPPQDMTDDLDTLANAIPKNVGDVPPD